MAQLGAKVSLVILMGLPGSGKSTFSESLKQHMESTGKVAVVISYDKLVPLKVQECFKSLPDLWRQSRDLASRAVELFISASLGLPCVIEEQYIEVGQFQLTLSGMVAEVCKATSHHVLKENSVCASNWSDTVFILDDNMYYRSMRYEYYQIARKHNVGYCILHVDVPVEEALKRNDARQEKVPAEVVTAMASKLEVPQPSQNKWEEFSFVIDGRQEMFPLEMVTAIVDASLGQPVTAPIDDSASREHDRVVCSTNVAHQADKVLRKMVASHMNEAKSSKDKTELKLFGMWINSKKQDILEGLKNGTIILPADIVEDVETVANQSQQRLEEELKNVFDCTVSKENK